MRPNHTIKLLHPGISLEVQNVQKNDHENILTFLIVFWAVITLVFKEITEAGLFQNG